MVFVIVSDQPFHLGRIETAVGLSHVDDRQIQAGEDVDFHPRDGQNASQNDGENGHHHGVRPPQRKYDGIHGCSNSKWRAGLRQRQEVEDSTYLTSIMPVSFAEEMSQTLKSSNSSGFAPFVPDDLMLGRAGIGRG